MYSAVSHKMYIVSNYRGRDKSEPEVLEPEITTYLGRISRTYFHVSTLADGRVGKSVLG